MRDGKSKPDKSSPVVAGWDLVFTGGQARLRLRRVAGRCPVAPFVMSTSRYEKTTSGVRELFKNAIRALPPLRVINTEYVPQLKRRPDQGIDRAAALAAIEHADLPAICTLDCDACRDWADRDE